MSLSPARTAAAVSLGGAAVASYWGIAAAASGPGRRLVGGALLSRIPTTRPVVALTFDDGPDPVYTHRILEALGGARSTFFLLGERASRWPSIVRDLTGAGHEAACHGHRHQRLTGLAPRATMEDLRAARGAIGDAAGTAPAFYRPPHGIFNLAAWVAAPRLGMRRTLWSASSRDWAEDATADSIARRVLESAVPGAVILLHDSGGRADRPAATLAALPAILAGLAERGLRAASLSDLLTDLLTERLLEAPS